MSKRKQLSKKSRFEVFKRDEFTCQYCGATPPEAILQADHIVPVAGGGDNSMDNLITACRDCNQGKSANSLRAIPESLKEKAARIAESEEQIRGYRAIMDAKAERIEAETWDIAAALERKEEVDSYNRRRLGSIKRFLSILPYHEVMDAAEVAASWRDPGPTQFKYFCGICWRKAREVQHGAS